MKRLEVDRIGAERPLTEKEEKQISDFINQYQSKSLRKKNSQRNSKSNSKKLSTTSGI